MESFTHEEFIRALQMEGKEPHHPGDPQSQRRAEEEREKRLEQAALAREAARLERGGGAGAGGAAAPPTSQEYTHEMYIEALRMEGKVPRVTPESLQQEEAKRQANLNRLGDVAYKRKEGATLAQQWEQEHEAEEIIAERAARRQAKEAQQGLQQAQAQPPSPSPPPEASAAAAPEAGAASRPEGPGDNVLLQPEGHLGLRNHVLAVCLPEAHPLAASLRGSGVAVTPVASFGEAVAAVQSNAAYAEAAVLSRGGGGGGAATPLLSLNVVVYLDGGAGGDALCRSAGECKKFVADVHRIHGDIRRAGKIPGIAVLVAGLVRSEDPASRTALEGLASLNQPPYVVCTVNPDNIQSYVAANSTDFSWDDEVATFSTLVETAHRDTRAAKSGLIRAGVDHDLTVSAAKPVKWVEIAMHWKGCFDLDLSCILLNRMGGRCGMVYFANLEYGKGAFEHSGDMMTAPKGAAECIRVLLDSVPAEVRCMYFVSNSYSGEPYSEVEAIDACVSVSDAEVPAAGGREVFTQFPVTGKGGHLAVVLCRVFRTGAASWGVTKIDMPHDKAETARALVSTVQKHFRENMPVLWESDLADGGPA